MSERMDLLLAIGSGFEIYPLVKKVGYGWALEEGLIRHVGPETSLDFQLTQKGMIAIAARYPIPEIKVLAK
jgi:hypothetical protein